MMNDLEKLLHDAIAEIDRLRAAIAAQSHAIEQTLGKALGYPRFADDKKNFPDATGDDVCVGEHTAETLAVEAAGWIENLKEKIRRLQGALGYEL